LGSEGIVRKWEPRLVQKHKYRQSKAESFGKGVAHDFDTPFLEMEISFAGEDARMKIENPTQSEASKIQRNCIFNTNKLPWSCSKGRQSLLLQTNSRQAANWSPTR
jgi:hypothetical protein